MSEEQAQKLMQQLQMLEAYLTDLLQKEETILKLLQEATSATESIKALDNKVVYETLLPVGLGAFIKAKVEPNQKLIINVGAGASIEQDRESALNYIESRIKELEIVLQQLAAQRQEVSMRIDQGQQEMNKLIQSARGSTQ